MSAQIIDGRAISAVITAGIVEDVAGLDRVVLATLLVGDDPASHIYVRRKHEAAAVAQIETRDIRLGTSTTEDELLAHVAALNEDDEVDGILVQLPLPSHISARKVLSAVDPAKDVDGFHLMNAGGLYLGRPGLVPATPSGVLELLLRYDVPIKGSHAVVVGRSAIVGRPMAILLLRNDATVTVCHRHTVDLAAHVRQGDIVVVAVGQPRIVTADMVKPGAVVIDVGINRTEAGIVGDVAPEVCDVAALITPVPGGVGPMTIAMVLRNTVKAARLRRYPEAA